MSRSLRGFIAGVSLIIMAVLASCSPPAPSTPPAPTPGIATQADTPVPDTAVPAAPTAPRPPDLSQHPLYWFAPLPPLSVNAGRPYTGSDDFMQLFSPDAPWAEAAGHIQVFKLYGEWVAYKATDAELRQVVEDLRRRGMALAVEAGPLDAPGDCGQGVESFAGKAEGRNIARRIKAAGGVIHIVAMDEPYFFAHFYDGPNACHWPVEQVARAVDDYIQVMRAEFPDLIVGDTEPLAGAANAESYKSWLDTFRAVNGYDLAFLHMDMDWSRASWPEQVKSIEDHGRSLGVPVGIIYTGNYGDATDEAWLSAAGERVKRYELQQGGQPDHVLFQSWLDKPDRVLPESEPYTWTWFINAYFADKSALGVQTSGSGANLAFHQAATASRTDPQHPLEAAVDGDTATWWGAAAPPVQWIAIDLGAPHNIREIRLTISQYPVGQTVHRVAGKGPATNGAFQLLHTFSGLTSDSQVLSYAPPEPWKDIQVIRIQTIDSPSWVSWREIEVIDAGE